MDEPIIIPFLSDFFDKIEAFEDVNIDDLSKRLNLLLSNHKDMEADNDELLNSLHKLVIDVSENVKLKDKVGTEEGAPN